MDGQGHYLIAARQIYSAVLVLLALSHKIVAQGLLDPRCEAPFGNFPDPGHCDRYVSCWGGRGFSQSCGINLVFHPIERRCQAGTSCPGVTVGAPDSGQKLRLVNGFGPWAGHLHVKWGGSWAYVDARGWSHDLGDLVCKQLGYESYEGGQGMIPAGGGTGPTPVLQLGCPGAATSIIQCSLNPCSTCVQATKVVTIRCKKETSDRCPKVQTGISQRRTWDRWQDKCYLVLDDYRASRDLARRMCQERGGNLITIDNQAAHEYISELLASSGDDLEFYTDGAGVQVGGLRLWVWETTRSNLQHQRWWPGWNTSGSGTSAPTPSHSPSCIILKKSYPLSPLITSTYDSGFFYFSDADCSLTRPFLCQAPLEDAGCYVGDGSTYSGVADEGISGRSCLSWDDPRINSLHDRDLRARNFDLGLLGPHSFCRNPDRARSPWCFVEPDLAEPCKLTVCSDNVAGASISSSSSASSSSSSASTTGPGTRTSTLLRPLNPSNKIQPELTRTTTTRTTSSTAKVRCASNEYACEGGGSCVALTQVCDGDRQCQRGDDEHLCKRYLQDFEVRRGMTLLMSEVIKVLPREDLGVCAKRCIDNDRCKGFIYDDLTKRCSLTSTDVSSSGLVSSSQEVFYELRSRRSSCGSQLKCDNERCVDRSKSCDGVDDCGDRSDESQCQASMKYETRLVGGSGNHEGNVQIQIQGEWGWICDDGFGFEAADLICKGLGFPGALTFTRNNKFGVSNSEWRRSSPKFWMDDVSCTGRESSFFDCSMSTLGVHDCGPTEIAGVVCRTGGTVCNPDQFQCGQARLHTCVSRSQVCDGARDCFDGSDEAPELCDDVGVTRLETRMTSLQGTASGTVFIKYKGKWGTVCDDNFDEKNAKVICRSLGYENGWAVPYPRAFFGRGRGDIFIDDPRCRGKEQWIGECPGVAWGVTDCDHTEDVGVLCSDEIELRLVNGPTSNTGRIEVKLSGKWGTVCDDDFDDFDAQVVCHMLGYHGDAIAHKHARYGQGTGPIWLDSLDCNGEETNLQKCKRTPPGASDCTHSEDAAVTCYSDRRSNVDKGLRTALPDGCGRKTDSSSSFLVDNFAKIVGGTSQQPLEDPWLVSLQLREDGKLKHNCGGVVIAEDYVLTAAHCFKVHGRQSYVIRVGDYKMNLREDDQEDFQIEKLWVHDEFDTTVEFNNDIAILKVARRNGRGIRFSRSVQPICLPKEGSSYSGLKGCSITGWGTTSERAPPIPQNIPRSGLVTVYDMSQCTGPDRYGTFEVTSGMVCAGDLNGQIDTCTGDSGGPLTCSEGGRSVLYGITSWGKGCGRRGQPGMYTKMTKYLRWIHDTIV